MTGSLSSPSPARLRSVKTAVEGDTYADIYYTEALEIVAQNAEEAGHGGAAYAGAIRNKITELRESGDEAEAQRLWDIAIHASDEINPRDVPMAVVAAEAVVNELIKQRAGWEAEAMQNQAGGYVIRPGGPLEGAPHCPRCGSSVLTPTDEDQYYNEFKCDLCGYVFPSDESDPYENARGIWEPHPYKAPGRWDGVTHPGTRTASARTMVPEQTLAQIGTMNLMAISGLRWGMENGDMILPISSGYRVRITLDADDTYSVIREMKRGDKIFVKGTQSGIYAEELGEAAYQASSYKSNDFGGHVVGSKTAFYDDEYGGFNERYDDGWNTDFGPFGDEPSGGSDDMEPFDVTLVCDQCGAEVSTTITWAGQEVYCPNGHGRMWKTKETTAMTHPHREAQLLEALEYATPREAVRISSELDDLRHAAKLRREAGNAIDWDAVQTGVPGGPVPPGIHTVSTDWMADAEPVATPDKVKTAARTEAQRWLLHVDPVVLDHPEELEKQALDHVAVWSTRFPNSNLAHRTFVASLTELLAGTTRVVAERRTAMERRNITSAQEARDFAVDWQYWVGEQNLSYGEMAEWSSYFEGLAEQYPELAEEFRENGII